MAGQTILTLVRHGETAANHEGVWHGSIDSELSARGRAQVARVAAWVRERRPGIAAVYSSPLQRARHTAEAIAAVLERSVRIDGDLSEYDLGSWEGKTYAELHREHRLWHHMREDPDYAPHGGETPREVARRIAGALQRIGAQHAGARVAVVAHGGATALGLGQLLDGEAGSWRRVMDNCAVSELVLEPAPALLLFNHTAHLAGL